MPSDIEKCKPDAVSKSDDTDNYTFRVKWKNTLPNSENAIITDDSYFIASEICSWDSVKNILKGNGAIRVTYFDAEGDEIPIDSQCEFREFLKHFKKNSNTQIIVEKLELTEDNESKTGTEIFKQDDLVSSQIKDSNQIQKSTQMAPKDLDAGQSEKSAAQVQIDYKQTERQTNMASSVLDFTEFGKNSSQEKLRNNAIKTENSEDAAPKWFTNYMQTMKNEMITEISQKVTTIVMEVLTKKRQTHYESASSHPNASDSEYLLDSDSEPRIRLADQTPPYFSKNREIKLSDPCSRSVIDNRFENPRRNYRHTQEKQRKKRSWIHTNNPQNPDEIWHSPSLNRRRAEKTARNKREFEKTPRAMLHKTRSELISLEKSSVGNVESLGEKLESPYRRSLPSEMKSSSSTPVFPADVLETPILKLRLANPYKEPVKETEEKTRMACSVTGQDLLEIPNDINSEYCALSDSDNISIISDVSQNSDKLQRPNGFEIVASDSPIFTQDIEDDLARIVTTEIDRDPQEAEDPENARDSSSFELLSEPPASPTLSIHMDEDHFATAINETKNYNINDDTTIEKRGNHSKIDNCSYAIDAHGKIYQPNIINGDDESAEIVLEKRTGGAYSFVGEALPTLTKEGAAVSDNSDWPGDRIGSDNPDDCKNKTAEEPDRFVYHTFYDSTQSFHSHTAQQAENNRQDFSGTATASQSESNSRSHVFTDHNASKGLGDTKKSSPKKQTNNGEKCDDDSCRSEQTRSNRRSSQDSQGSGNRNNGSRHDPRSRRFANWSTTRNTRVMDDLVFNAVDPMHILPETIVTGAVHVAFGAYTTARRVYDKILTAQMRNLADRSQSKFGRR